MSVSDKFGEVLMYIGRHANVSKDTAGQMRGLENDSLDEKGQKQADELRNFFSGIELSGLFCDDLERTKQTLLPIAEEKHLEIQIDTALRSWDIGSDLEGRSIEAHKAEIAELKAQPWKIPVGGQSWGAYEDQILTAFDRYENLAMAMNFPIFLMLHGSGISIIARVLGATEMKASYDHTFLEPAGLAAIYLTRKGLLMHALRGGKASEDE